MAGSLRTLLRVLLWPIGRPYRLHRNGRSQAAAGLAVAFLVGSVVLLSAVPRRLEPPRVGVTGEPRQKERVSYKILLDEAIPGRKRSVKVRLAEKVRAPILQQLAYELRDLDPEIYPRTFIAYYLPDMSLERSAWATTHFTPSLQVSIHGSTLEQDQQVSTAGNP